MLLALRMRVFLAISFFIYGTNSQACPQWVTSMLEATLANHITWPGIQLTLSSPHCGLNCTTSVQSKASDFAGEPALFDDTPWRLASITKTFTAVAILKLAERAQLDLYAPAVQYLPGWAVDLLQRSQGAINAEQITTWHLLHHTSGLGDFATDPRWLQEVLSMPHHMWTQRSVIEWSTVNSIPVGSPGEVFHYSDTGYTLLGLILENVTRTDLAAAVRDLAGLDELNMLSTWWELLEPQSEGALQRAGQYHDTIDVTHFNPSFDLYGAGGLVSTSKDLNNFGRALYEGRVLDETTTQLMYVLEPSGNYGCGVVEYSLGGQQAWGHTGFWHTWLYWVPSLDLVISGASNQAVGDLLDADKLVRNVIDHGCTPVYYTPSFELV
ncbi:hypothetical protein LTR70_001013 [Exophiala xenobiotica]|uniref:Beta-lactamase-related domain-containing protein n=1 Tax=Lithohypha guttulata TaxID=1690604 RepID=A0ABR0KN00_9EURO|nr:hypothetical protein LTR24_000798 [Lithohypha guttulata]KAK5328859.1 hypothetical protein LTR70_001013 [Exophiala xenobiotica]